MNIKRLLVFAKILVLLTVPACTYMDESKPEPDNTAEIAVENLNKTGYPIVNDKITLTAFQFELDNQAIDFSDLWFFEELEKKTNIHVEFEEIKENDWSAKLNLMFASESYSDLILRGTVDIEEYVEDYGVIQKLIVPLDDYLPEYMPIYYSRLQLNNANEAIPASDGKSYFVGFLISQDINTNGHWFINQNWLNKLGLQMPKTIEELTNVLYAFKTMDPNGNGAADEVPYQATFNDTNTGIYNMFAAWGVPENTFYIYIDETEKVRFTGLEDGYRQCLEWLSTLYADGIIDRECISQDSNLWGTKVNSDISGFFTYWRLSNSILFEEIQSQFTYMIPVSGEGYEPKVSSLLELTQFGAALTVHNKYIGESLRWLDAQMETETMMVSQNGPIGEMIELNEEGKYEIIYVPEHNDLYSIVPVICGQFFAPADYYSQIYEMAPHRVEKAEYCREYEKSGVMEYKSYQYLTDLSPLTSEEHLRVNKLYNDINKYMTEALTNFITRGVTDESWQSFSEGLDALGVGEYVALYQRAYDEYLENN